MSLFTRQVGNRRVSYLYFADRPWFQDYISSGLEQNIPWFVTLTILRVRSRGKLSRFAYIVTISNVWSWARLLRWIGVFFLKEAGYLSEPVLGALGQGPSGSGLIAHGFA